MGSAYSAGLHTALRRWPVAVALFVANLIAGVGFATASWMWLADALDSSLPTRTLLTQLDMNVFVDLFMYHMESLQMLAVGGALLGIVSVLLWVWLNAVAVVAVAEEGTLSEWMRRGWSVYARFFRLWLLAAVIDAISGALVVIVARWLIRWTAESPSEMTFYWIIAASAAVGALLLLFVGAVHDHARIHSIDTESGALRAWGWAFRFVVQSQPRALPLALLLTISAVALWGFYQCVSALIPVTWTLGVALSIVWGEAWILARMILRLWNFAAATELQAATESAAD